MISFKEAWPEYDRAIIVYSYDNILNTRDPICGYKKAHTVRMLKFTNKDGYEYFQNVHTNDFAMPKYDSNGKINCFDYFWCYPPIIEGEK